ncbi:MAG: dicarboxylate/amino acid:cation symporter [Lentisphaeria bacterium]|nr:dicarboxylate/amino acid:cation symporter [Lentisphaeria bacterium]
MNIFAWYKKIPLIYLNLAAFVTGCIAGLVIYQIGGACGSDALNNIVGVISPFGNILVYMLKMIVIPIIFFSIIHGTANLPLKTFGKMGIWVCVWYFCTSLYSVIFGTVMAFIFNPSLSRANELAGSLLSKVSEMQSAAASSGNAFLNMIYGLFANPFQALAKGDFLPVIVYAILFGLAIRSVADNAGDERTQNLMNSLIDTIEALQKATFKIIEWVMLYFPIGVFALTASSFAVYGISLFNSYLQVALCVISGIVLMLLLCYPLFVRIVCKENPYPILWKLREPILTAFVTRSSAATIPVSMRTVQEKLKVRKELAGFTISLGATVNMDGVCVHLPVFAVLAANMFGIDISFSQILLMVIGVVFASVGAGGVPGGSIFLLFMVLGCFNLTQSQTSTVIALALGINPLLDMFETACNVAGDNVGAYVVGKKMKMLDDK